MILTLYLALLALAVIVVGLGVVLDEQYFTFVGLFFFFSLGILLLSNGVTVKTGETVTPCEYEDSYVYGDNYSGYHWDYATPNPAANDINIFHVFREYEENCSTITTYTYATGTDSVFWYGFLMALSAGFGMFALFWNAKRGFKKWEDEARGSRE